MPCSAMEGISGAVIDEVKETLEIKCNSKSNISPDTIASKFVYLLNNPEGNKRSASTYTIRADESGDAQITYAERRVALVMKEGDSVFIFHDYEGVGIPFVHDEYRRLCQSLDIPIENK